MSKPADNNMGINAKILLICSLATGTLGIVSVFIGWITFLLSVTLFGIVQLFIAALAYCHFFVQQLLIAEKDRDTYLNENESETMADSPPGQPPPGDEKKLPPPPPYQLKSFLQRDYYIVLCSASALGLVATIYVLLNLDLVSIPMEENLFLVGVAIMVLSFCYMFAANWLNLNIAKNGEYEMIGNFFRAAQVIGFLSGVSIIIKAYGFYQVEYGLIIIFSVLLSLSLMEVGINAVSRLIVDYKNENIIINLHVLPAVLSGKNPIDMLLLSLEKRSGITIRSAWTYGFVRRSFLPLFLTAALLFWLMTGLIQINTDEKGVVYRFGQLQKEAPLLPGLHLKWPWPVDTVRVLPAYSHHQFTVGYDGEPRSNYLWTSYHGGDEYKFLLGDGKELVSINLLVTYKISDIYEYLMQFENPEEVLQAKAYEILMQEIVKTNIDDLLSRDRAGFSRVINNRLQKTSDDLNLGLEVINVALPSIHPPVDIAREYQEYVGAQIQKQILIIEALTYANSNLPGGEAIRDRLIAEASINALTDIAEARGEEIKSVFQEKAFASNPEMYRDIKWLEAFENALEDRNIYLIVDEGDIWLDMRQFFEEEVDLYE